MAFFLSQYFNFIHQIFIAAWKRGISTLAKTGSAEVGQGLESRANSSQALGGGGLGRGGFKMRGIGCWLMVLLETSQASLEQTAHSAQWELIPFLELMRTHRKGQGMGGRVGGRAAPY